MASDLQIDLDKLFYDYQFDCEAHGLYATIALSIHAIIFAARQSLQRWNTVVDAPASSWILLRNAGALQDEFPRWSGGTMNSVFDNLNNQMP